MNTQQPILTLTDRARLYLQKIQKNSGAKAIYVALEKAGCAGYMYKIEPLKSSSEGGAQLRFGAELTIVIPKESIDRIKGSRLDYQKRDLDTKAVFFNPNVQMACGCGDSVELLNEKLGIEDGQ